jgi:hypothetical protein
MILFDRKVFGFGCLYGTEMEAFGSWQPLSVSS